MSNEYNSSDPKQVKKAKTKDKLAQERNDAELENLVNTPGGAYLIWRILEQCQVHNASENMDPQYLAFREGQRSIGLWLMSQLFGINEKLYTKVRYVGSDRDKGSNNE